jgi:hypothetical protein
MRDREPGENIVTETESAISRQAVNLLEEPDAANLQVRFCEGLGPTDTWCNIVAPPGNQAVNGENKHQPDVSGETGLLDSVQFHNNRGKVVQVVFPSAIQDNMNTQKGKRKKDHFGHFFLDNHCPFGFIMQKYDYPLSPILLALILGPMAESNLQRALVISSGHASILFSRPIAVVLMVLAVTFLVLSFFTHQKIERRLAEMAVKNVDMTLM